MGIIQIAPATRRGMRLMLSFYGMSETGKTLSALKVAAGLEPNPAKRGLLDTEGGQRGRAYVDQIEGGYLYGCLSPPFTPERYIEALTEFEAAGVNVLVIDSVSHAWFSTGGVLDMVDAATERNDMAKWKVPKRRLAKMTQRILTGDMHMILCSRGKQPMVEEVDQQTGKKKYVLGDVVPIQEKSLRFDMTVMAQMLGDGKFTVARPAGKCPGTLRALFSSQEVMDESLGKKLGAWVEAEGGKSPEQRKAEVDAAEAAEGGTAVFTAFWNGPGKPFREMLRVGLANYQSIAKAADVEADQRRKEAEQAGHDLEDPFSAPAPAVTVAPASAAALPEGNKLSEDATRALTSLRACTNDGEFDATLETVSVEVCRELGADILDEIRSGFQTVADARADGPAAPDPKEQTQDTGDDATAAAGPRSLGRIPKRDPAKGGGFDWFMAAKLLGDAIETSASIDDVVAWQQENMEWVDGIQKGASPQYGALQKRIAAMNQLLGSAEA